MTRPTLDADHLIFQSLNTPIIANNHGSKVSTKPRAIHFAVRLSGDVWRVLGNVPDLLERLPGTMGARGMNLGIEDAYVFAALVSEGRVEEYETLRQPVVAKVMRQVERMTAVPRGRSLMARLARLLLPVVSPVMPAVSGPARTFILGLDHEVALSRNNPETHT